MTQAVAPWPARVFSIDAVQTAPATVRKTVLYYLDVTAPV